MALAAAAVNRTPSAWRNMLENRVRKLSGSKPVEVRREALVEIIEIASEALDQLDGR